MLQLKLHGARFPSSAISNNMLVATPKVATPGNQTKIN